ncbi:MAG: hypothetical protein ACM3PT_01140 [Deltaproteobacteria bacterium]
MATNKLKYEWSTQPVLQKLNENFPIKLGIELHQPELELFT